MDDPGPQFIDRLDRDKLEALIETMYLVAFADGDYSESERSHFATSVAGLTGGRIAPQSFDHVIDRVTADLRGGRERCIASLKQRLDDPELRQIALILATDMAAADGILHPDERDVIAALAVAFDMDPAATREVLDGPPSA